MKRIVCLLLISVLLISTSVSLMAQEIEYTFVIEGEEISISGVLTEEEAYEIAYLHYCIENNIEVSDTYSVYENGFLWSYDSTTETVTVSGEGDMEDYVPLLKDFYPLSPILCWLNNVEHIVVEEGVTGIGESAFFGCSQLKTVALPNTLKTIGNNAFGRCDQLKNIEIPCSVDEIDYFTWGMVQDESPIEEIFFCGDFPGKIGFPKDTTVTVYYPKCNKTWTEAQTAALTDTSPNITWVEWDPPMGKRFSDISADAWYTTGIEYVYKNGIMSGMGNAKFAPAGKLTREQLMQVFFAMEGLNKADYDGETGFSDAPEGRWYSPAIKWAKAEGITDGIKENIFGMGQYVTREQLATFIMNYTEFKKGDVSARAELASFSDADEVSDWAVDGMEFCVEKGIINGRIDGTLDPRTPANRAELAQILMQYAAM